MTRLQAVMFALCSSAAACGTTSDAAPAAPTAKMQAASTATLQQQCVATFTRSRACTDQYIPALVDARARLDQPAGIAAAVKSDRDGAIARAKAEWANDSADDAIAAHCQAIVAQLSPEDQADASREQRCLAEADCGAFVTCEVPMLEKHLAQATASR